MHSETLHTSSDGMLTQGRNWRRNSPYLQASTRPPARAPRALCWALSCQPSSEESMEQASRKGGLPGRVSEPGSTVLSDSQSLSAQE